MHIHKGFSLFSMYYFNDKNINTKDFMFKRKNDKPVGG